MIMFTFIFVDYYIFKLTLSQNVLFLSKHALLRLTQHLFATANFERPVEACSQKYSL